MRCFKIPLLTSHYSLLFAFVLSAIFSFFSVSSSFAVSDLVVDNISSSSTLPISVCASNSDTLCSPYDYIILSCSSTTYQTYLSLHIDLLSPSGSTGANYRIYSIFSPVFSIPFDSTLTSLTINSYSFFNSSNCTLTLTENSPFGSSPSGNIDITQNGSYDVTNYATATVNVENQVIQGDYHDDLVTINNSILICGAIVLILYFFYCIYRIFIVTFGGRQ